MKEISPEEMVGMRRKAATDAAYKAHQENSLPPEVVERIQAAGKRLPQENRRPKLRTEEGEEVEILPNTDPNIFEQKPFNPKRLEN